MNTRFLRTNSQYVAAVFVSGFVGSTVLYKANKGYIYRNTYEIKNSCLSLNDEKKTRQVLFRLKGNLEHNIEFFRANTLDFVPFGFSKTKQGAQIGIPATYLANNVDELLQISPTHGFENFFGKPIRFSELSIKLTDAELNEFYNNLIMSEDAKLFGIGNAIVQTNLFITGFLENLSDFVCLCLAYMHSYSKSRYYKMQLKDRRFLYFYTCVLALTVASFGRYAIRIHKDKKYDEETCKLGIDCCEGSIEYYDKLIKRNKILRQVIEGGHHLIDPDGNYIKQTIRIPFTNFYFFINYFGLKLTDRRENCRKLLLKTVNNLIKEKPVTSSEILAESDEKEDDGKEWQIFKQMRLRLEEIFRKG